MLVSQINKVCIEQKTKINLAEPFENAHGTQRFRGTPVGKHTARVPNLFVY
jgi:hypothetical protein